MGKQDSSNDPPSETSTKETLDSDQRTEDGLDPFKKPDFSSHVVAKKNILRKYLLSRKGFVSGGTLGSVPDVGSEPTKEPDEKKGKAASQPQQLPPPLKYDEPEWADEPADDYFLEEIKSGVIEKRVPLKSKSFFTFGRLESCDIPMAHPTVSRYHAVLQYRGTPQGEDGVGFYLYDLGSTHGTFLNKYRIKSKMYGRVRVGHMIKIGCSSRFFILQGPDEDIEEESELSFTELKQKRDEELKERKLKEEREIELEEMEKQRQERLLDEKGVSWGMGEDADEETDLSVNPYAVVTNEELYIDDPKKALRLWFEREGEELNYEIEKAEKGMFVCKVVLPVDGDDGRDVTIETSGKSKKETQVQCALEACRALDKLGVFRPSKRDSKKAKKRNWEENDYYDSDEDSFFDRTGDLEKKRHKRMEKAGKITESVETYDSLKVKYKDVIEELSKAEKAHAALLVQLSRAQESGSEDMDELDQFMANLKKAAPSKAEIKTAQSEVEKLKREETRLRKLVNIAKPATLPELKPPPPPSVDQHNIPPVQMEAVQPESSGAAKVIGPSFPPPSVTTKTEPKPPQVSSKPPRSRTKKPKPQPIAEDEFEDLVWRPPQGQTGDGRTSLNDKLGY